MKGPRVFLFVLNVNKRKESSMIEELLFGCEYLIK